MSVFCISDVHGQYDAFMRLLDAASPSSDDNIYILGDIIDRGPGVGDMLAKAVELTDSQPNVHFLAGNHEQMVYNCFSKSGTLSISKSSHWVRSNTGSKETILALKAMDPEWRKYKLAPWFASLSLYDTVDVEGQKWMLVHAGFSPKRFDGATKALDTNESVEHGASVEVGYGFGRQMFDDMLWIRKEWINDANDAPLPTVHGHTPTTFLQNGKELEKLEKRILKECFLSDAGVLYYRNKIDIDCGAGIGRGMTMLRLDDFEEFHTPIEL